MTVRGRTISPRLRPVEKGGTELIQPSRRLVAVPLPEEGQRFRAASRVPSTSKTIRAAPSRSTRPPVCRSFAHEVRNEKLKGLSWLEERKRERTKQQESQKREMKNKNRLEMEA